MALSPERHGDAFWFKATAKGLEGVESQWDLWTGKWAIVSGLENGITTQLLSGDLQKTTAIGEFYGHASADLMETNVQPGKYAVVCKAYCNSAGYEKTFVVESLTVKTKCLD